MLRSFALLSAFLFFAACSSGSGSSSTSSGSTSGSTSTSSGTGSGSTSGSSTGGSSGGTSGAYQLLGQVAQIECNYIAQCGLEAAYEQAACATQVNALVAPIALDLDAGLVTFNASAAPACLGQLEDAGCAGISANLSAAQVGGFTEPWPPEGAATKTTTASTEPVKLSGSCPGNCVAYAEVGQPCTSAECDSNAGLSCTSNADGGFVCEVVQVADAGRGGTCDVPATACEPGLYCSSQGTCANAIPDGGSCTVEEVCIANEVCVGTSYELSPPPGTCLPAGDVGTSCLPTPDGGSSVISGCLAGLACLQGTSGTTCQIPPSSGPCSPDLTAPCETISHVCVNGMCVSRTANGGPCDPMGESVCQSSNCTAVGDGGVCAAPCEAP